MQPGTPSITSEDLVGLASSLSQLACFRAVIQSGSEAVELETSQLIGALVTHDPVLAMLVSRWCEAAKAMREHVIAHVTVPLPADPFRVSACGHAM